MAEEIKQEEKEKKGKKVVSTIFKFALGLVFLILGILVLRAWIKDFLVIFKGCIGMVLILAGIITLAIAKE